MRGELSKKRRRDTCGATTLTKDRGDGGALTEFIEGGRSLMLRAA
jgi:hypothetical protein